MSVSVRCKHCGEIDMIVTEERVPRERGIRVFRNDDGTLRYEHNSYVFDETGWEWSETVGFVCRSCARHAWKLEDIAEVVGEKEE